MTNEQKQGIREARALCLMIAENGCDSGRDESCEMYEQPTNEWCDACIAQEAYRQLDAILSALAAPAPQEKMQPALRTPKYGHVEWQRLIDAIGEVTGVPWKPDESYFIGHQAVPHINMNSLNRIVSALVPDPAPPAREETIGALRGIEVRIAPVERPVLLVPATPASAPEGDGGGNGSRAQD